jgi:hypothetical protein
MSDSFTHADMKAALKQQLHAISASTKPEVLAGAKAVCLLAQTFVNVSKSEIEYTKFENTNAMKNIKDITPKKETTGLKRENIAPGVTRFKIAE